MSVGALCPSVRRWWRLSGLPVRCHTHRQRGFITTAPVIWTYLSQRLLVSKSCLEIPPRREQKPRSPGEQNILSLQQSAGERYLHWRSQFSERSSGYCLPGLGDGAPMASQAVLMPATTLTNSVKKRGKLFSFLFCAQHNLSNGKDLRDHVSVHPGNWIYHPWILPFLSSLSLSMITTNWGSMDSN